MVTVEADDALDNKDNDDLVTGASNERDSAVPLVLVVLVAPVVS